MNNFEIVVKRWSSYMYIDDEVDAFIQECTEKGHEIEDVTSHVYVIGDRKTESYTFIFKVKKNREKECSQ